MQRRTLLKRATQAAIASTLPATFTASARAEDGVDAQQIVIGSSMAMSGMLGGAGQAHSRGIEAAFAEVNKAGGVQGRKLKLALLDDGYVPARTAENVNRLLTTDHVFALLSVMGTPNTAAALAQIDKLDVPCIGAVTGADTLRAANSRNLFFVRASYRDETVRLVQQLGQMGLKSIAIVRLDNAFGSEVAKDAEAALSNAGLTSTGNFALAVNGGNADALAQQVVDSKPNAILMGTTGSTTTAFALALRRRASALPMSGLSVSVIASEFQPMGSALSGFATTQVLPDAQKTSLPMIRRYQAAMKAAGVDQFNGSSLEGWVNAQVLIEGLKRAGNDPTRDRLRNALDGMSRVDLGGFTIGYGGAQPHVGSQFIELAIFGEGGRRIG